MGQTIPQETHEQLFTSGEYVRLFQPEVDANPFAATYAAKRDAVLALVEGQDRRVLDVGGGPGRMALPLAQRHDVTMCDISGQMLDQVRPHAPTRLTLKVADARALPFPGESFDYALLIDVLPHLPELDTALAEARRVLVKGGRLIIDSTNHNPLWMLAYPRYAGRKPGRWLSTARGGGVPPEWQSRVWHRGRGEFLDAVSRHNFRVLSVRGFGPRLCPKWHLALAEAT